MKTSSHTIGLSQEVTRPLHVTNSRLQHPGGPTNVTVFFRVGDPELPQPSISPTILANLQMHEDDIGRRTGLLSAFIVCGERIR